MMPKQIFDGLINELAALYITVVCLIMAIVLLPLILIGLLSDPLNKYDPAEEE
jgi:hypothetical protein